MSPHAAFTITIILLAILPPSHSITVEIIHSGNIYGRLGPINEHARVCYKNPNGCFGGMARLVHSIKQHKSHDSPDNIVLNLNTGNTCGDSVLFEGQLSRDNHTSLCINVLEMLQLDAAALGDLELEHGEDMIKAIKNRTEIPILSNIRLPHLKDIASYKIFERPGLNVAVIGFFSEHRRGKLPLLYTSTVLRLDQYLPRVAKTVRNKNAEFVIAFGVTEFETFQTTIHEMKDENLGVDVIICSSRQKVEKHASRDNLSDDYPRVIHKNKRPIYLLYSHGYTKSYGHLVCDIDSETKELNSCTGKQIHLDATISEDDQTRALYEKTLQEVSEYQKRIIGHSSVFIDGHFCNKRECNFGNVITDAYVGCVEAYSDVHMSDVAVGLVTSSSILGSLTLGENDTIDYFDLMDSYKTRGNLTLVTLTGKDLLATLELGVFGDDDLQNEEFLQVSGLHYTYDPNRARGSRISDVRVRWRTNYSTKFHYEDLDLYSKYVVVTNREVAYGLDDHYVLRNSILNKEVLNIKDGTCVREYFSKSGVIITGIRGRITRKEKPSENSLANSKRGFIQLILILLVILMNKIK